MKLKFPTMAEQAIQRFEQSTKTISFTTIAKEMNAERGHEWPSTILWHFDDDTTLRIFGTGRSHRYEALLP